MIRMKQLPPLMLVVALAGCSPYVLAVRETYEVATDPRSLATQATDTQAEVQIKAALLASPVSGTSGIDVYCRQGVVVLVGVVPPGSQAGQAAVQIARQTPGVKRVETYFVPPRPSWESDIAISGGIRAVLIADPARVFGPGRHRCLRGACRAGRGRRLASQCPEVHCRRKLGKPGVVSVTSYIQTV